MATLIILIHVGASLGWSSGGGGGRCGDGSWVIPDAFVHWASLARDFALGQCSSMQPHGRRAGTSARCVTGPVQKPWQLSSDTSWQQEATTAMPVLGSMGLWGQSPPSPGPGHFPGWGKLSMGQRGHLPPSGWRPRAQRSAVPCHTLPCVPSFSPPHPDLPSPCPVLASWDTQFTLKFVMHFPALSPC